MKLILLFSLALFAGNVAQSQSCSTVKVISPQVTQPTSASIVSSSCSTLVVTWQGSAGQTYYINATRYNPTTNIKDTVADAGITRSCNGSNSCTATIPVIAGTQVTWSVQAISTIGGNIYYSYALEGTPVNYPILACGVSANTVALSGKVILQGAYDSVRGLMNRVLDSLNILQTGATLQPYNITGFDYNGPDSVSPSFFDAHPNVVDWVMVELRDAQVPQAILNLRVAFVLQDGTLIDTNTVTNTKIIFSNTESKSYYVAIRHRNHLGAMTAQPVSFATGSSTIDFASAATVTYGTNARKLISGVMTLWAGDANGDRQTKYNGASNDKNAILSKVGLTTPNNVITGYHREDANLDGKVRYNGAANDKNVILGVAGISTANNVVVEQIPNSSN
jgi:hypothetical protein